MNCHINMDICFTANVFMYLYKYLFKGPDRTKFAVRERLEGREQDEPVNEIDDYVSGCYLSATEASWRILAYDITRKEPAVVSIAVHLPGTNFAQMM